MLHINPKKFKPIKNKTIPNPMRPRFRNRAQANIYFLSQRKVTGEKKEKIIKNIKLICIFLTILIGGYLLSIVILSNYFKSKVSKSPHFAEIINKVSKYFVFIKLSY